MSIAKGSGPLSGGETGELCNVLLLAFPKYVDLARLLKIRLGENLETLATGENLGDVVFRLIEGLDARGEIDRLLAAAIKERPHNAALGAFAARRGIAPSASAASASPAPLPPNNLPPRRLFVGREVELASVTRALEERGQATITPATSLYGLGGIGKTALALEYAHKNAERYPGGLFWMIAEGKPEQVLLGFAAELRLVAAEPVRAFLDKLRPDAPAGEVARAVCLALQGQPDPSLLVLDNVDTDGWNKLIPGGRVRVLLTTRDKKLGVGAPTAVDVLPEDQARALAQAIAGEPPSEAEISARERVLKELGGLAVAVEIAARSVAEWAGSWSEYERLLQKEAAAVLDDAEMVKGNYERGALAALDLSIDRCAVDTVERRLLEGAAVFAPESVPIDWAEEAAALESGSIEAKKSLASLRDKGLVKLDEVTTTLSLHRLVHARIRTKAENERWLNTGRRAAEHIRDWLVETVEETRIAMVDAQRAHVDEALHAAERAGAEDEWITIANMLAQHLKHRAAYEEAQALFEQALARAERLNPPVPGTVATLLSNLALVLQDLGKTPEARPLAERALAIGETTYGREHPDVAVRLSNLAVVLLTLGKAAEARPLLERSLAIEETTYGRKHPQVATRLSNLAMVLLTLGKASQARPLVERALGIYETTYGREHPEVAACLSNLAAVLRDLGKDAEAKPLLKRALAIVETTYGPEHPIVALRLTNLAVVLKDLDNVSEARPLLERAVVIVDKTLPPDHPWRVGIHEYLDDLPPS
jgi:tetratricopeptide (TPR) repeat protein